MAIKVLLEVPDEVFDVYKQYADKHGCDVDEALLIPIKELVPIFARDIGQVDSPKR